MFLSTSMLWLLLMLTSYLIAIACFALSWEMLNASKCLGE